MSMGLTGVRQFPGNLGFLLEPKDIASKIPGVLCSSHLDSFDPLLRQTKTFLLRFQHFGALQNLEQQVQGIATLLCLISTKLLDSRVELD